MGLFDPTEAQAQAFFAQDQSRPVIFINLHKYNEKAQYPDGYSDRNYSTDCSGQEAYHRYLWQVEEHFMPQVGARLLIVGPIDMVLIGEGDWDEVVVGHYPSKGEAMRMTTLPGYAHIAIHRRAGLQEVQTVVLTQERLKRLRISDA